MRLLAAPLEVRPDLTAADVLAMIAAVVSGDTSVRSRRHSALRALELLLHGLVPRDGADQ